MFSFQNIWMRVVGTRNDTTQNFSSRKDFDCTLTEVSARKWNTQWSFTSEHIFCSILRTVETGLEFLSKTTTGWTELKNCPGVAWVLGRKQGITNICCPQSGDFFPHTATERPAPDKTVQMSRHRKYVISELPCRFSNSPVDFGFVPKTRENVFVNLTTRPDRISSLRTRTGTYFWKSSHSDIIIR